MGPVLAPVLRIAAFALLAVVIGAATALVVVTTRLADRTTSLEDALVRERRERRELDSVVCVMAHVGDRADRIVMGEYERRGRLDRRMYLPDYPRC